MGSHVVTAAPLIFRHQRPIPVALCEPIMGEVEFFRKKFHRITEWFNLYAFQLNRISKFWGDDRFLVL